MSRYVITEGTVDVSSVLVGRAMDQAVVGAVADLAPQRVAVVCQPSTYDLAASYAALLAAAGFDATGYTLPDGEDAQPIAVVEEVYRYLNGQSFTRSDVIMGVGGGALTDVAGFVAGTYLRGIPAIYVPTPLLGAVDAAIGGKTGVNVDGKNLAGVFRHPDSVIIDIDTLDRLPLRQRAEGAAEAIKTGLVADMAIVEAYEADGIDVDLALVVDRSVAVKAAIVSEDFTERDRRAILNYGHTIGHAIETSTGRSHGTSVAIGMVAAGAAGAHLLGFSGQERQEAVLERVGLPLRAPEAKRETVRALMALDKKRDATGLRMVLLRDFMQPEVVAVDDATVEAGLHAVGLA